MIPMETGLFILLFTYGFSIAYHVMGSTKFYMIKEFDGKKALLGLYQELGYFLFLLLLFLVPQYVDLAELGINIDINLMVSIVLIFPMMSALNDAYKKALELRNIDISELNKDLSDGAVMNDEDLQNIRATAAAPTARQKNRVIPMKVRK